jgi:hypothetical protein
LASTIGGAHRLTRNQLVSQFQGGGHQKRSTGA